MAKRLTPAEQMLRQETEADFQQWLIDTAHVYGWRVHFWADWMRNAAFRALKTARRRGDRPWPDPGFPDVWCIHPERGELVVFECKRETAGPSAVSEDQHRWLNALTDAGVFARVVRPRDRDAIIAVLSGKPTDL